MEAQSLFNSLLEEPSLDKFLRLRNTLVSSENYDPYSTEIDDMQTCVKAGDAQGTMDLFKSTYPNLLISPAAHFRLADAYEYLGNKEWAKQEKQIGILILQCIMEMGDGTRERPYLIARITDEYDVLNALGKESGARGLLCEDSRLFDMQRCIDGTEVFFDVTDVFQFFAGVSSESQTLSRKLSK